MKKILLAFGAVAAVMIALPLFSAFEAHVINVTAQIENALSVPVKSIDFGTVFPQEKLDKPLAISLSDSFIAEGGVDDVEYIIRQKPKCAVTNEDGTRIVGPTWTGHVVVGDNPFTTNVTETYYVDCDADRPIEVLPHPNPEFWLLPSLCEYISKHSDTDEVQQNDDSLNSFHQPFTVGTSTISWLDTKGRLAKSDAVTGTTTGDVIDTWTIDLAVPCFGGYCAQDWDDFVLGHNPEADPDQYTQPIGNEHKVFGCDLWVETTRVSRIN